MSSSHEDYLRKLDEHSHVSRYDPLRDACRRLLAQWAQEDEYEKNDLSGEFWQAINDLRTVLESVKRGGEEDVPEVEVTYDRSPVPVEATERHPAARRSGAKNLSDPIYQNAFISESRAAMGAPSLEDAQAFVGQKVTLIFNVDWHPATGRLTEIVTHPSSAGPGPHLILDKYRERVYPLYAIQEIRGA